MPCAVPYWHPMRRSRPSLWQWLCLAPGRGSIGGSSVATGTGRARDSWQWQWYHWSTACLTRTPLCTGVARMPAGASGRNLKLSASASANRRSQCLWHHHHSLCQTRLGGQGKAGAMVLNLRWCTCSCQRLWHPEPGPRPRRLAPGRACHPGITDQQAMGLIGDLGSGPGVGSLRPGLTQGPKPGGSPTGKIDGCLCCPGFVGGWVGAFGCAGCCAN